MLLLFWHKLSGTIFNILACLHENIICGLNTTTLNTYGEFNFFTISLQIIKQKMAFFFFWLRCPLQIIVCSGNSTKKSCGGRDSEWVIYFLSHNWKCAFTVFSLFRILVSWFSLTFNPCTWFNSNPSRDRSITLWLPSVCSVLFQQWGDGLKVRMGYPVKISDLVDSAGSSSSAYCRKPQSPLSPAFYKRQRVLEARVHNNHLCSF